MKMTLWASRVGLVVCFLDSVFGIRFSSAGMGSVRVNSSRTDVFTLTSGSNACDDLNWPRCLEGNDADHTFKIIGNGLNRTNTQTGASSSAGLYCDGRGCYIHFSDNAAYGTNIFGHDSEGKLTVTRDGNTNYFDVDGKGYWLRCGTNGAEDPANTGDYNHNTKMAACDNEKVLRSPTTTTTAAPTAVSGDTATDTTTASSVTFQLKQGTDGNLCGYQKHNFYCSNGPLYCPVAGAGGTNFVTPHFTLHANKTLTHYDDLKSSLRTAMIYSGKLEMRANDCSLDTSYKSASFAVDDGNKIRVDGNEKFNQFFTPVGFSDTVSDDSFTAGGATVTCEGASCDSKSDPDDLPFTQLSGTSGGASNDNVYSVEYTSGKVTFDRCLHHDKSGYPKCKKKKYNYGNCTGTNDYCEYEFVSEDKIVFTISVNEELKIGESKCDFARGGISTSHTDMNSWPRNENVNVRFFLKCGAAVESSGFTFRCTESNEKCRIVKNGYFLGRSGSDELAREWGHLMAHPDGVEQAETAHGADWSIRTNDWNNKEGGGRSEL